jgi:hypothetical protein
VEVGDDVAGVVPDEARAGAARHGEDVARPDVAHHSCGSDEHHRGARFLEQFDGGSIVGRKSSRRPDRGRTHVRVEDHELACQRDQRDQQNGLHLNDAFITKRHLDDRVLEFHGDQQRHDHSEDGLKDRVVQRIERRHQEKQVYHADQLPKRDRDDHRNHRGENHRHNLFEALV